MTVEEFRALYPALSQSLIDEQIDSNILLVNVLINKINISQDLKDEAYKLLLAHLVSLDAKTGSNGTAIKTATSKKVGDVQYSYSNESGNRAWYNLTGYGQKLLMLLDFDDGAQPLYGGAFVV